ncbi:MAG: ATP-binding cassette domain-containing protein [Burkholderiales bacterium]|nr:ATP-binding cassette domain-containing protein [Burkholderiales bacterium]
MSLLQLIRGFVGRNWRAYVLAALMLLGVALLTVWLPRKVGQVIDALAAGTVTPATLVHDMALLLAAGLVIYLLRAGWRLQLFAAAYRLGFELRTQLYERLTLQGPRFFQRKKTGDLMARATNDVDAVELTAGEAFLAGFDGTMTLVLVVAMMALGIDWRLALIALLPFPLMALAFWVISRHVHDGWRRSLDRFSEMNEHVQETVSGVRTVRALGLEPRAGADFSAKAGAAAAANFDAQRWESAYEPAVGLTLTTATVLTLGVGGWLVQQRQMTVGELTAFTMYLGQLIWPAFAAGWVMSLIERGKAAWARLDPVLREPPAIDDRGTRTRVVPGALVLERLTFAYAGGANALTDVSVTLPPGTTLGVVGPTGAGKSTLLHLLLRHYEPTAGSVMLGGHAMDEYRLAALRTAFAWVPQEAFLFSASIAENIALSRPGATRADIERVAQVAAIHDDILRFPLGYDTPVGERGVTLSGGQRQRLAIARALLAQGDAAHPADVPILLLDDALSAVDTGTETQILAHLRGVVQRAGASRTSIIVSHRLSAVVDAQQIIVLQDGRVNERGSHEELLRLNGWYAAQWRYQQLEESLR